MSDVYLSNPVSNEYKCMCMDKNNARAPNKSSSNTPINLNNKCHHLNAAKTRCWQLTCKFPTWWFCAASIAVVFKEITSHTTHVTQTLLPWSCHVANICEIRSVARGVRGRISNRCGWKFRFWIISTKKHGTNLHDCLRLALLLTKHFTVIRAHGALAP